MERLWTWARSALAEGVGLLVDDLTVLMSVAVGLPVAWVVARNVEDGFAAGGALFAVLALGLALSTRRAARRKRQVERTTSATPVASESLR